MAPPTKGNKRSADDSTRPFKKSKPTSDAPSAAHHSTAPTSVPYKSSLVSDEVDFPRGGGSTLTPLEFKEATNEARKEADADALVENSKKATKAKKLKQSKGQDATKKGKTSSAADSDTFRVEHLNYKRLSVGTPLLGQVHSIHPLHLVISLPNQLFGHVPITQVSKALTTRLSSLSDSSSEASDDDEEEKEDEDVPSLESLFEVGRFVRARVSALFGVGQSNPAGLEGWKPRDDNEKSCRRVELTLDPEVVNEGVAKMDLEDGFTLTAAVSSIEDHGYILDIGMDSFKGFLSFKDSREFTPNSISKDGRHLQLGQLVDVAVLKMADNKRTCNFTVNPAKLTNASLSNVSTITSLLPGTLVQALITAVVPGSGLNLKLLGFFDGTIDLFHLPPTTSDDLATHYKVGKKIKARITYLTTSAADQTQRFGLSLLDHVISLSEQKAPEGSGVETMEEFGEVGTVFEKVTVVRVESEWGLVVDVDDGVQGYVHISHVSDEHTPTLPANTGAYKIGSSHKARVIGHASLDGLLQLTLKPSILEQKFMKVSEVKIGEVMKGTIKKLTSQGLFVNIHGSVDGVCWPLHYADIRLKNPERRFKAGSTVKCRILATDTERNRLSITLKKTLVESDLPIVASFEDAQIDTITDGVVSKFLDKGMLVDMYGGVRAFVPISEASDSYVSKLEDAFFVGKPVKIKIVNRDPASSRLVASIKAALPGAVSTTNSVAASGIEISQIVSGTVSALHAEHVLLTLLPSQVKALLTMSNLANHRGVTVAEIKTGLKLGETLDELVVVAKNDDKGIIIVANAPKKKTANAAGAATKQPSGISQPLLSYDSIPVGETIPGRVVSHSQHGALVQITKTLRGRIHPTDASDDFKAGVSFPEVGKLVHAVVLKVDAANKIIDLSVRPSRVSPDSGAKVVDREVEGLDGLEVGQKIRGFVKSISNSGLFVSLGRKTVARVMIKDLFDEFVKDWQPRFEINQVVEGKISKLDPERSQVELTFRTKAAPEPRQKQLGFGQFAVGQKVDAVVKKVETFGIFLRIEDSTISGLCHKSELSDDASSDVGKALRGFREGDKVKTVILSLDADAKKISFGIKPSYFDDEDFEGSDDDEDEEEEGSDVEMVDGEDSDDGETTLKFLTGDESDEDEDEEEEEDEDDEETVMVVDQDAPSKPAKASKALKAPKPTAVPSLALAGGFSWSAPTGDDADTSDEASDSDDDAAALAAGPSTHKKKKTIQQDLTADLQTRTPESTTDFERLLLGSPNSSFLWIQYMSFQLQISEIDKAREIGRRAIKTIGFREEEEKLNVWVALLNLENAFGTEESLEKVAKEAMSFNDPKTVLLRLAAIFEQSEKSEKAEETFQRAAKKFGQSSKVWTLFAEYLLKQGKLDAARELLPRSLKSLEKRKHLKTISKFAQLEFKCGDSERGKTIFEGIVDSHPKRLDLWNVYIDLEAKMGDLPAVRRLFERVLTIKLSQKKAKSSFKKWMDIERRLAVPGDESGAELVKAKAIAYVQRTASVGGAAGGQGGDDEMDED